MKTPFAILVGMLAATMVAAQVTLAPDTLFTENFNENITLDMLPAPSGSDDTWVNYDGDNQATLCGEGVPVPGSWYWEGSLSLNGDPTNYAMTSCSYFESQNPLPNANWLILPPVFIPSNNYKLAWKSMPFQGPAFMDGYKVLVSSNSNDPALGSFTDTLFLAASMTGSFDPFYLSLSLSDYEFSPGFIHAQGYTQTAYFDLDTVFLDNGLLVEYYRGRLQPFTVNLDAYAGQTIYIAFLHDSNNNYLLQLDDIIVSNNLGSGIPAEPSDLSNFVVSPNPAGNYTSVHWELDSPQWVQLSLIDLKGRILWEKTSTRGNTAQLDIPLSDLPSGVYSVMLQTQNGRAVRRLVKQ